MKIEDTGKDKENSYEGETTVLMLIIVCIIIGIFLGISLVPYLS